MEENESSAMGVFLVACGELDAPELAREGSHDTTLRALSQHRRSLQSDL